jgi:hypothetical protein
MGLSVPNMYPPEYVKSRSIDSVLLLRGGGKVHFDAKMSIYRMIFRHHFHSDSITASPI